MKLLWSNFIFIYWSIFGIVFSKYTYFFRTTEHFNFLKNRLLLRVVSLVSLFFTMLRTETYYQYNSKEPIVSVIFHWIEYSWESERSEENGSINRRKRGLARWYSTCHMYCVFFSLISFTTFIYLFLKKVSNFLCPLPSINCCSRR